MIQRSIHAEFEFSLSNFPVTGIIGPRQVGKTTLAKTFPYGKPFLYLDLEKLSDLNKLNDPEIDLLIRRDNQWLAAAEIKLSLSPKLTKGSSLAMKDLGIKKLFIISPVEGRYFYEANVEVLGVKAFLLEISSSS